MAPFTEQDLAQIRLRALVAEALALADDLDLTGVGIDLDAARVKLDEPIAAYAEGTTALWMPPALA